MMPQEKNLASFFKNGLSVILRDNSSNQITDLIIKTISGLSFSIQYKYLKFLGERFDYLVLKQN